MAFIVTNTNLQVSPAEKSACQAYINGFFPGAGDTAFTGPDSSGNYHLSSSDPAHMALAKRAAEALAP